MTHSDRLPSTELKHENSIDVSSDDNKKSSHQKIIKDQLRKFLDLEVKQKQKQLSNAESSQKLVLEEEIKNLERLSLDLSSHGFCLGFTLSERGLDIVGQLNWWKKILKNISEWNGNEDTLTPVKADLTRVLNYVISNFAGTQDKSYQEFKPNHINQLNLLDPASGFFEVVNNKSEIFKPAHRVIAGGHFTSEQLGELLDERICGKERTICLIHSEKHVIGVGFDGTQWFVSNSNYPINKIRKSFKSKEELLKAISKIFKNHLTLAIDMIQLEKISELSTLPEEYTDFLKKRDNIIKNFSIGILDQSGILMMQKYTPESLLNLIEMAPDNPELTGTLLKAISKANKKGISFLNHVTKSHPMTLCALLKLADQLKLNDVNNNKENLINILRSSLVTNSHKNWSDLQRLAYFQPTIFNIVADLIKKIIPEILSTDIFNQAVLLSTCTPKNPSQFMKRLTNPEEGCHALITLAKNTPSGANTAINLLAKDKQGYELLIKAVSHKNADKLGLQIISAYLSQETLNFLIITIAKYDAGINLLASLLTLPDTDKSTTQLKEIISNRVPQALSRLTEGENKQQNAIYQDLSQMSLLGNSGKTNASDSDDVLNRRKYGGIK